MELKLFLYIILSENYGRIKNIFHKEIYKKYINIYTFVYIDLTTERQQFYIVLRSKCVHFW